MSKSLTRGIIMGIDPGLTGGIVVIRSVDGEPSEVIYAARMPSHYVQVSGRSRRALDHHMLANILREWQDHVAYAVLEEVNSMPRQGVASTFTFGKAAGSVEMGLAALQIPYTMVRPHVWKRTMKVPSDKIQAMRRATQIFPGVGARAWPNKSDDGVAEAALLAAFGARTIGPRLG